MPGDLLVITPSRGRPESAMRLLKAVHATSTLATHVAIGVDADDPELPAYEKVLAEHGRDGDCLPTGPRMGLCEWTNRIAKTGLEDGYPFLASLGDDHVPVTKGWDAALTRVITDMGGTGFSYPWMGTREDVPEGVVISADIVQALGWMCLPGLAHWYPDDVWADLGWGAGCIQHCRAVKVDHLRADLGKSPVDRTTTDSAQRLAADKAAYQEWRATRMAADIATVRALRERVPAAA